MIAGGAKPVPRGGLVGSLFSGGGGWDVAAIALGLRPLFAVEYEAWIAKWHEKVFPETAVMQADVAQVDFVALRRKLGERPLDVLVSSPPCQEHSRSGKRGATLRASRGLAKVASDVCDPEVGIHTLRAVDAFEPSVVLLENVPGYQKTNVYQRIVSGLRERGYDVDQAVVFAEDHGVPSARSRLILRASKHPLPPWPEKTRKGGWWASVQGLRMPKEELAPWQQRSLKENPPTTGYPALIAGGNATRRGESYVVYRGPKEVAWTTQLPQNTSGMRVLMSPRGPVYRVTARAVARLQSFPDAYPIEGLDRWDAIHVLGNSVPPRLGMAMLAPFVS